MTIEIRDLPSVRTTSDTDIIDMTPQVQEEIQRSAIRHGYATLFVPGSTAALMSRRTRRRGESARPRSTGPSRATTGSSWTNSTSRRPRSCSTTASHARCGWRTRGVSAMHSPRRLSSARSRCGRGRRHQKSNKPTAALTSPPARSKRSTSFLWRPAPMAWSAQSCCMGCSA